MVYFNVYTLILLCVHYSKGYRSLEKKIVGGKNVSIENYPHAVFLEIVTPSKSKYICGSSVLNQFFLITVAHCVYTSDKQLIKSKGIKNKVSAFAGHEHIHKAIVHRKAKTLIIHDEYSPDTAINDIALLLLKKELPLGKYIKRIIIRRSFPRYSKGTLTGWGIINDETEEESLTLQSVSQKIKSYEKCIVVGVVESTFCAGTFRSSRPRGAPGDSGGGLVTENYQLLGLLSYKMKTYSALLVYTNVSYFYNWIHKNAKNAVCTNNY